MPTYHTFACAGMSGDDQALRAYLDEYQLQQLHQQIQQQQQQQGPQQVCIMTR